MYKLAEKDVACHLTCASLPSSDSSSLGRALVPNILDIVQLIVLLYISLSDVWRFWSHSVRS